MTTKHPEITKKGFTIFGRYGCFFTEGLLNICHKLETQGKKIDYKMISLHETPYENKILDLKGNLPNSEIQLHEVIFPLTCRLTNHLASSTTESI